MANELDETDVSLVNESGRDVHVIDKKVAVKVDWKSTLFTVMLCMIVFCLFPVPALCRSQNTQEKRA